MSNYEYLDDGYVEDGYAFTGRPFIFQYGATRIELRGPSRRSGSIRLLQAEEYSSGWARYGYTPIAAVHTLALDYQQMRSDECAGLLSLRAAVDDTTTEFSYINGATGEVIPARFVNPEQSVEEVGFNHYRTAVTLQSLSPFFPYPANPPADIAAILANVQYPYRATITRKQPRVWMSDGTPRIANKSAIKRTIHTLPLVRKSATDLGNLFSYFQYSAVGIQNKWSWTFDSIAHQVRFAEAAISWQQSQIRTDLFDLTLTLEEDA